MCKPWKPGDSIPEATVSTVTVAYPLAKSMVTSATCLPSAVFIWVVSLPALEDPDDVVDVAELLEPWLAQALIARAGIATKPIAAANCLIMNRLYPSDARHKPRVSGTAWWSQSADPVIPRRYGACDERDSMVHRDHGSTEGLLQELLWSYGPCGQEDAVRAVCTRELQPLVDDMWSDGAGNLIGYIAADANGARAGEHRHRSTTTPGFGAATRVMAHMDELSMLVKRVEPDGTLHLTQLGTMYPGNFGLGPVAVLGENETFTAVLTLGSEHTTKESQRIWQTKPDQGDQALDWDHVYVFTGRSPEDLDAAGVRPGTRVCVDRSKRTLVDVGDYVGCYFLDDRAAVTALLRAARLLREGGERPADDAYLVFTTNEEIGGVGGTYASATLPGTLTLALEVGPTEREYATTVSGGPIVGYSDALCVYDKDVADRLMRIATDRGFSPQAAVLGAFESDASHSKANGLTPRAGLLCLPTLSTHGYEVMARGAIEAMSAVIVDFLLSPVAEKS
jgi:putative aminopeptidase FrvX